MVKVREDALTRRSPVEVLKQCMTLRHNLKHLEVIKGSNYISKTLNYTVVSNNVVLNKTNRKESLLLALKVVSSFCQNWSQKDMFFDNN